jgi:citrate synthase
MSLTSPDPETPARNSSITRARGYGLDDVVVADTELSDVDGRAGRLLLRGHSLEALAGKVSFEALLSLLWEGALPTPSYERTVLCALGAARARAHARLERAEFALELADPMDALRAFVATLPSEGEERALFLELTASIAVVCAAWHRRQSGLAPLPPRADLAHADDFLRLLRGALDAPKAAALATYWVTVADHGLNASTFAARVVASTDSDTVSAVTAAIGALKGRLHGGAPGPVLTLLDAVGSEENARKELAARLARGERIMGMGHRVYRVRDPRADVLEQALLTLMQGQPSARLLLARKVEREATALLTERHPDRPLRANVEFFTAVLLEALGIPRSLFTAVFAAGRIAGWCAHIAEQRRTGRIMRPSSRYVGPRDLGSPSLEAH